MIAPPRRLPLRYVLAGMPVVLALVGALAWALPAATGQGEAAPVNDAEGQWEAGAQAAPADGMGEAGAQAPPAEWLAAIVAAFETCPPPVCTQPDAPCPVERCRIFSQYAWPDCRAICGCDMLCPVAVGDFAPSFFSYTCPP